jgi:hypothetical protein
MPHNNRFESDEQPRGDNLDGIFLKFIGREVARRSSVRYVAKTKEE